MQRSECVTVMEEPALDPSRCDVRKDPVAQGLTLLSGSRRVGSQMLTRHQLCDRRSVSVQVSDDSGPLQDPRWARGPQV